MRKTASVALVLLALGSALVPLVAGQGTGGAPVTGGNNTTAPATPPPQAVAGPAGTSPWPVMVLVFGLALLMAVLVARASLRRGR